jgi:hypothetical protein
MEHKEKYPILASAKLTEDNDAITGDLLMNANRELLTNE